MYEQTNCNWEGRREGGRKGGREGGREGGKKGGWEGGKKGEWERGKMGGWEGRMCNFTPVCVCAIHNLDEVV